MARGKDLVIVESPAKAKTIEKYLGGQYKVKASMGHLRDLPKSKLGVDIEKGFEPEYIPVKDKKDLIAELKKDAKSAGTVYLATDPDREGEAISWHLKELLELDDKKARRVTFNEITKKVVTESIEHPRAIDSDLVDAQQARRILDRIVGYKISPLLWKKVKAGLSAGRVQSVATRMVVDREDEIKRFVSEEFWLLDALLDCEQGNGKFTARFYGKGDKKTELKNEDEVKAVIAATQDEPFVIRSVKRGEKQKSPAPPFITSTLQQEASRRLAMTPRRTMSIAQQLYEGVEISGHGTIGLITYMRTDSLRLSEEALAAARSFITERYGKEYYPGSPRRYKTKAGAQDAHEAIRPTYVELSPEVVRKDLTQEQYRLYRLIWGRFTASQMANAVYDNVAVEVDSAGYSFHANYSELKFPGYTAVYEEAHDEDSGELESPLPALKEGERVYLEKMTPQQQFTQPPARYTEATLIRAMEEKGIGRPSTYAPTITAITSRDYVIKEGKYLRPTPLGEVVTELMKEHFGDIVDLKFTNQMESELDETSRCRTWRATRSATSAAAAWSSRRAASATSWPAPASRSAPLPSPSSSRCRASAPSAAARSSSARARRAMSSTPAKEAPTAASSPGTCRRRTSARAAARRCSSAPGAARSRASVSTRSARTSSPRKNGATRKRLPQRRPPRRRRARRPLRRRRARKRRAQRRRRRPRSKMEKVTVLGAGLAGSECAWQLAKRNIPVRLVEMKPEKKTPAHVSDGFAELVCSNSLRSDELSNAVGLLKAEMRALGSLIMESADQNRVAAGGALAVDREGFSRTVTERLCGHPLVEIVRAEATEIPEGEVVIATGPLSSDAIAEKIAALCPESDLHFYDAVAPIVTLESVDMDSAFFASRYDKGTADYVNCPMDRDEYLAFVEALASAKEAPVHGFDDGAVFEGCMPVEVMARRGVDTLRYGPLKPVGLVDPRTGKNNYAVVQLRRDNAEGTLYNLVGFQTHLTWGEQKRVFSMIPALRDAEFVRYGVMHRNTYLNSPKLLDRYYRLRSEPRISFAGQMTGVEGYVESAASGLLVGVETAARVLGLPAADFPQETAIGALALYVSGGSVGDFQPMNINFGLITPLERRVKGKRNKNTEISKRSLAIIEEMLSKEILKP